MTRVLQIVYEMASCPWTDFIGDDETHTGDSEELVLLSSPIPLFPENDVEKPDGCEVLLRSILLRAQYGGMAGDMKMLHDYVHVWNTRFRDGNVPTNVLKRIHPTAPTPPELKWISVPAAVHSHPKLQSHSHVTNLVQRRLDKLTPQDICTAGVDFHCSSVLDHVIADESDFERCYERLCAIVIKAGLSPVPANKDKRRSYLMQVMKSCMWKFSSGINHRRPLLSEATKEMDQKEAALKSFWDENLAECIETYMKKYVRDRLAR